MSHKKCKININLTARSAHTMYTVLHGLRAGVRYTKLQKIYIRLVQSVLK